MLPPGTYVTKVYSELFDKMRIWPLQAQPWFCLKVYVRLVQVKHLHKGRETWVISVPWRLYPGLCTAMHIKFNHPSKLLLTESHVPLLLLSGSWRRSPIGPRKLLSLSINEDKDT